MQYYYCGAFVLATWYAATHWQNFDGGFHRPGNKFKKQKRKAERSAAEKDAASRDASTRGSNLEDALEDSESEDDESEEQRGPRRSFRTVGTRRRDRSRAEESRRRSGGRGDGRYAHYPIDEFSPDRFRDRASHQRNQQRGHPAHRVQQVPGGEYVAEDEILDDHPSQPPLRPVNAHHKATSNLKQCDFAAEDKSRPGRHSIRQSYHEAYDHLYGAHDTGHDFIDGA